MPFPNFHAARLRDPDAFARIAVLRESGGVMLLGGPLKSDPTGPTKVQTVRFPRSRFTPEAARRWLVEHKLKPILFEEASEKKTAALEPHELHAFVSLRTLGVQALVGMDILSMVPEATVEALRKEDPHPFLQAFSICHEGDSRPTVLGEAVARVIRWTREAVQSLKRVTLRGVQFFLGHNEDNSTDGRRPLGEVVWDGQREIDGVLHHVVVGYFPDKAKVQGLDICSQEAEWNFVEGAKQWIADRVKQVTAIALSSSSVAQPAFAGARRLASVQATTDVALDDLDLAQDARRNRRKRMSDLDLTTIPFGELSAELKRRGTFPSQLFTEEDLKKDRVFAPVFDKVTTLEKSSVEKDEQIKKLKEEGTNVARTAQAATARVRFDKMLDDMKLTPKLKSYLQNSFPQKVEDATDEALKRLIDSGTEAYKVAIKTFGVKEDLPEQRATVPAGGDKDFTKAKDNPLLEEDVSL